MSAEDAVLEAERAARDAKRAAQYADEAAAAIFTARHGLDNALHLAGEAGEMSGRGTQAAAELQFHGEQFAGSQESRRPLMAAEDSTTTVNQRAVAADEMVTDLRAQLARTQDALRTGRRSVDQISRLPGERHELVDPLKDRLDVLEDAVRHVDERATEVAGKLAVARGNVGPLVEQSRSYEGLQTSGQTVQSVGQQAARNLAEAGDGLTGADGVGQRLESTSPALSQAERESVELERALRAAANPTQPTQQQAAGSAAGEGTFRINPSEPNRGNDYSR
ncbi:MAG: hypothetical protein QOH03_2459 [Kribbellaceae bacterium]|jgi:predicted  nucleic acid-binding Zn-ribbon protein|nr:hypothetical protein [Kribbellaceae bacterium]